MLQTNSPTQTITWQIDPVHSGIHFTVKHLVISKVRGRFSGFSGAITTQGDDLGQASVQVEIDAATIDTGIADRDKHLTAPDFFDVAQFPKLSFVSKRVEAIDSERFRVVGDFTLHGVTREVVLDAEDGGRTRDPWGGERAGFTARTSIDRRDYGLEWNQILETGGLMVGTRIDIELEIQAVKQ